MTPRAATPLEPCPFCGAEADFRTADFANMEVTELGCKRCGIWMRLSLAGMEHLEARWNRRAPSSPLVGELREALDRAAGYLDAIVETHAKAFPWPEYGQASLAKLKGWAHEIRSALARAGKERG